MRKLKEIEKKDDIPRDNPPPEGPIKVVGRFFRTPPRLATSQSEQTRRRGVGRREGS
jgi:hypothetical protein